MNPPQLSEILEMLKATKESHLVPIENEIPYSILHGYATQSDDNRWVLDRSGRIDLALMAVSLGAEIEQVVSHLNWKDFESFIARILREHNYECVESFRQVGNSDRKGMEIDVIGIRNRVIVSVDAKMWSIRGGKASALRAAAEKQAKRTHRLGSELSKLAEKVHNMQMGEYVMRPMVVTWLIEDVEIHDGVPVVPVFKFNSFLLNYAMFEDRLKSFTGILGVQYNQTRL
ncbi:hypothetical protein EU537_02575 [Candidatus Thorarchaeota archaeon]|nr:MAG: hypothetical protein EU537_02575 [Candidatus Thorarchaeota archaeon]